MIGPEHLLHEENNNNQTWGIIANLDSFFFKMYNYYVEKGFWCIIVSRLTNLL